MDSLKLLKQEIDITEFNMRTYNEHIEFIHKFKKNNKHPNKLYTDCDYDNMLAEDARSRMESYETLRKLLYKKLELEDNFD